MTVPIHWGHFAGVLMLTALLFATELYLPVKIQSTSKNEVYRAPNPAISVLLYSKALEYEVFGPVAVRA